MAHEKFDLRKLEKLNDLGRFETLPPDVFWQVLGAPAQARTIIEIGAGTGLFAARFSALAPDAVVYAADIAPVMIEWMSANRPEVEQGRLIPLLAEENHVPLPDALADIVYMINLHHELESPLASYREALRLLGPGGRFLAADWAPGDSPHGPPQHVRASASDAAAVITAAGFDAVVVHAGALPYAWLITAGRS